MTDEKHGSTENKKSTTDLSRRDFVAPARRMAAILYALLRDGAVEAPRHPAALPDSVPALCA